MNTWIDANLFIDKVRSILPDLDARADRLSGCFRGSLTMWTGGMYVLSSDWSDLDSEGAVQSSFTRNYGLASDLQELILISRFAVIPSSDPKVQALTNRLNHITPQDHLDVPSKPMLNDDELLGSAVRRAFVFKAQRSPEAATDVALNEAAAYS